MNVKKEVTMKWEDAPDTISPEIYAQIRGISQQKARDMFNIKSGDSIIVLCDKQK